MLFEKLSLIHSYVKLEKKPISAKILRKNKTYSNKDCIFFLQFFLLLVLIKKYTL